MGTRMLSTPPGCLADDLLLLRTVRYLPFGERQLPRHPAGETLQPRRYVPSPGDLWALRARSPGRDWIVLKPSQWRLLVPASEARVGTSWKIDKGLAAELLCGFTPPTHHYHPRHSDVDYETLRGRVEAIDNEVVRIRLDGNVRLVGQNWLQPGDTWAEANILGYLTVSRRTLRIHSLECVTTRAFLRDNDVMRLPYAVSLTASSNAELKRLK